MSNLWVPFVGIGILYREGYFKQRIDCDGTQIAERVRRDPCDLPVTAALDAAGNEVSVSVITSYSIHYTKLYDTAG